MELREAIGATIHKVWIWIACILSLTQCAIQQFMPRNKQFCTNISNKDCTSTPISTAMPLNAAVSSSETRLQTKRSKFAKYCFQSCSVWIVSISIYVSAILMILWTTKRTKRETHEPQAVEQLSSERQVWAMSPTASRLKAIMPQDFGLTLYSRDGAQKRPNGLLRKTILYKTLLLPSIRSARSQSTAVRYSATWANLSSFRF